MRHLVVAMALLVIFAIPAVAASAALPYNLTFSPSPGPLTNTGTVKGTFGGVPVTGTYTGTTTAGSLTLTVSGKTFATGTYTCGSSGCSFTGTVAGKTVTGMKLTASPPLTGVGKATSSVFPNHGAWVSAVSHWADTNLNKSERGKIVSDAAKIEGGQASGGRSGGSQGGGHTHGGATGHP